MIWVNFLIYKNESNGDAITLEDVEIPCAAVPSVGDSVQIGGQLRSVKHVRWATKSGSTTGELFPEVVVNG